MVNQRRLRAAGSALATGWFVLICAYCAPWDAVGWTRPDAVSTTVQALGMNQSWRMFRKPGHWNRFLIHEGLTETGEVVPLIQDTRPPEGAFLVTDYGRWRKVQYSMTASSKYLPGYADWVCRQAPDDVVSIRLTVLKTRKLKPKTARSGVDRDRKEQVLLEQACR